MHAARDRDFDRRKAGSTAKRDTAVGHRRNGSASETKEIGQQHERSRGGGNRDGRAVMGSVEIE